VIIYFRAYLQILEYPVLYRYFLVIDILWSIC